MFAGCIEPDDSNPIGKQLTQALGAGLAGVPCDNNGSWVKPGVTLVQQRRWNTAFSKMEQGVVGDEAAGIFVLAWLRLDNRAELLDQLKGSCDSLGLSDTHLILAAYLTWGDQLGQHLIGDFAIAVYDTRSGSCTLYRDHMGVKPLYYYLDGDVLVFATSIAVLSDLRGINLGLSDQWMARYLAGCSQDWEDTAYESIKKLPPAHQLCYAGQRLSITRYFEFSRESRLELASDQQYVEAYREIFDEAVRCRVQSDYPIGSESSGGLDSSSITALAAEQMSFPARDLHSFGFANCEQEPECILAVSQTSAMRATHLVTGTGFREHQFEQINRQFLDCHGAPQEHPNACSHGSFYEMANQWGIRTLLSGFGGDEFVTNYASEALIEFWLARNYRKWHSRFIGNPLMRSLRALKWLNFYFRHGNHFPTALSLQKSAREALDFSILGDQPTKQFDVAHRVLHQAKYNSDCSSVNDFILGDRWSPLMTARLENCTLMAARQGIEYRWPLLDIRLLKFYLSLPPEQKLGARGDIQVYSSARLGQFNPGSYRLEK